MKTNQALCFVALFSSSLNAQVLPSDVVVDGKTIGDWSAQYWQWILPVPTNQSPAFDPDGSFAQVNQPDGPVFFVSSVFQLSATVTRSFSVPEGKYLFVPLLTHFNDNVDMNPPLTVEQLRELTSAGVELIDKLHANIDGVAVPDLFEHRAASPVFGINFESTDHLYTWLLGHPFSGLNDPIVAEGYYLMLEPLPPGQHVINFGAGVGPPINFSKDITAYITVLPVPLSRRMDELLEKVINANLPSNRLQPLKASLEAARAAFARDTPQAGVNQLRAFQKKVGPQIGSSHPEVVAEWIQFSEEIIEQVKANIE